MPAVFPPLEPGAVLADPISPYFCKVYCEGELLAIFDTLKPEYKTGKKVLKAVKAEFHGGSPAWYGHPLGRQESPDLVIWYRQGVLAVIGPSLMDGNDPSVPWQNDDLF